MSQITTHVLDTTAGKPAAGITIVLFQQHNGDEWKELATGITNGDGRIPDLLANDLVLPFGIYKLKFEIKEYFDQQMTAAFYPYIEVVFEIKTLKHYHVPLLLSPFGYSTYRGS